MRIMSSPQQPMSSQQQPEQNTSTSLLQLGKNCWRIEKATKLQFLIDGEEYFRALRATLRRAQRSIYILGWDIDSRVILPRANPMLDAETDDIDTLPEPLAQFLDALARTRHDLKIYVLSWDYAALFAFEREWLPVLPLQWRTHRRVHFHLDAKHPVGASHHQKLVVVDDQVAFIGGIDITRCRWDTSAHLPADPKRHDADGNPYAPFHDVQAVVEGPIASALGELAYTRWQRATGRKPKLIHSRTPPLSPWPPELVPALENIRVAIARTAAPFEDHPACTEIRNFHNDIIAAARHVIFFENQYFSSNTIAQALKQRLQEADGPSVIAITPYRESGWLEENTMGLLRARVYDELQTAAQDDMRFRPYCPLLADKSHLNVHSKLMTVDDEWLTIGSANLSNRSMSLDTECNLILSAADQEDGANDVRSAIAHLRNRLLAEHLDSSIETLSALQQRMSLIDAIETVRNSNAQNADNRRTMICAEATATAKNIFLTDAMLIDPETPLDPEHVIAGYVSTHDRKPLRAHAGHLAIVVIIFVACVLLWRETPLKDFLNIQAMLGFVKHLQQQPLAPLWVMLLYVIGGFMFIPVVLLIAATGIVFGPWWGLLYALAGSLLSAAATFWIGSKTGTELWRRLFRGRARRLQPRLQERGLLAVAVIRAMPVAPFTVINLIAGAAKISWRDFLVGTFIGMLPGITVTVLFVDRVSAALRRPTLSSIATLVLTMGVIVVASLLVQHWLRHSDAKKISLTTESADG
jgi:phospholipase D1/2